jgi:hypothetical protein
MSKAVTAPSRVSLTDLAIESRADYPTVYKMALKGLLGPVIREGRRIYVLRDVDAPTEPAAGFSLARFPGPAA